MGTLRHWQAGIPKFARMTDRGWVLRRTWVLACVSAVGSSPRRGSETSRESRKGTLEAPLRVRRPTRYPETIRPFVGGDDIAYGR
jgi:hypothetical protein